MSQSDQHNRGGMFAFVFSFAFVILFFLYLSFMHPGVVYKSEGPAAKPADAQGGTAK